MSYQLKYPDNWDEMREAMFSAYGGKYCTEGLFKKYFHKGYIQLHHYVSISKADNQSEYYFLNQPWNLIPCCEKHHKKFHSHMNSIKGYYNPDFNRKGKEASYARRFFWAMKRQYYRQKFENRGKKEHVLGFWNYWNIGTNRLRKKMYKWPGKYLEELV